MAKRKGYTLVELIMIIGILGIVAAAATFALSQVLTARAAAQRNRDDQYNARVALLALTRDARHSQAIEIVNNELVLIPDVNGEQRIVYSFTPGAGSEPGTLNRSTNGDWDVVFVPSHMAGFTVNYGRPDPNDPSKFVDDNVGRWLTVRVDGTDGLVLSTTVAIDRIVPIS